MLGYEFGIDIAMGGSEYTGIGYLTAFALFVTYVVGSKIYNEFKKE